MKRKPVRPQKAAVSFFALLGLIGITLAAYFPCWNGSFVWDDDSWTIKLEPLFHDFAGLWRMWSDPTALQQYYPLTGTSFWVDYQLWKYWTLPYHVENVLLHAASAMLFWRLLRRLQAPGAWLAAAVFALHPVMVESAAWITERKNVLSLVLFLASLLAYGHFASFWVEETSEESSPRNRQRMYGLALVLFVCALLAKVTAYALPAVIMLLCWWKRGRIRWRQDVLPVAPFFALSIGFGMGIAWLEQHHVGAQGADWDLSWPERFLVAGRALWFYAGKLLWPVNQCFIYPRWELDAGVWWQWLYPGGAVLVMVGAWLLRGRLGRGPVVALLYFAGTLFPVLGFMNVYGMRFAPVADHWVYASTLGLIALGAGLVARAPEQWGGRVLLIGIAAVVLPLLAALTWRQADQYKHVEKLWLTTIERNPEAWLAYNNLGTCLLDRAELDGALLNFQKALAIQPRYREALYNLGSVLLKKGQLEAAIEALRESLRINPTFADAHNNLGFALFQTGQVDAAISSYKSALEIRPGYADAHNNFGNALMEKGDVSGAVAHFEAALKSNPAQLSALNNLAMVLASSPQAAMRNGVRAIELAQRACQITKGGNPVILNTLAAAYAESGRYADAVETAQEALRLATAQGNRPLVEVIREVLGLYQSGKPFRDTPSDGNEENRGPH